METVIQRLMPEKGESNIFYMKREDLLPFSMGGNKVRIAEAFYADMKAKGGDYMILYGSRHSNLCRVLSALCRSRGTACAMICSHDGGTVRKPNLEREEPQNIVSAPGLHNQMMRQGGGNRKSGADL